MAGPGDNTRNKPKNGSDTDAFKRALTVTMRAISGDKELEVGFAKDRPALAGSRARLPELPKKPSPNDVAVTRGLGDSMALKRACHDQRIHLKLAPEGKLARSIFDAVEGRTTAHKLEYRMLHKDGSIRWVWEQGSAVFNEAGNPIYLDGFIADITHRRELETILHERADQLTELNHMKDRFFTAIVHDLQNPVYSFISLSDFVCQNYDHFKRQEILDFLTQIRDTAKGMDLLLSNLMDWARAKSGQIKMHKDLFKLSSVVEDCLEQVRDRIAKKNLNLAVSVPTDLHLEWERQIIISLLRNLISNAVKYSQMLGKISINSVLGHDGLKVTIQDEGVGIPRSELPSLFRIDREYRRPGTLNEPGTGLGLLLVKEMMDLLEGRVEVQSRLNKGTKVILHLPAHLVLESRQA